MNIKTKRVYEEAHESDGSRILVDRLWPRGISKQKAKLAYWAREVSPSSELRKWYQHDVEKWNEFKQRYFKEIDSKPETIELIQHCLNHDVVTFLYSSRELKLNNAVALKEYVTSKLLKP